MIGQNIFTTEAPAVAEAMERQAEVTDLLRTVSLSNGTSNGRWPFFNSLLVDFCNL
jgi:hypothetical protein